MELKNTTTMIIGLVVSVVLVAGLMIPVISSLNSNEEGKHVNTIGIGPYGYPEWFCTPEDVGTTNIYATQLNAKDPNFPDDDTLYDYTWISFEDPTQNPNADRWSWGLHVMMGDYWIMDYDEGFVITWYGVSDEDNLYTVLDGPLLLEGTTITGKIQGTDETYTLQNVRYICCGKDMATYTCVHNDPNYNDPVYVGTSEIGIAVVRDDQILGFGKANEPYDFAILNVDDEIHTGGVFLVEEGYITGTSYSINGNTYSCDFSTPNEGPDGALLNILVPIEVGGSGSGGITIPNTLMSMISVIPLITVVGIVLGAVSIIRRN